MPSPKGLQILRLLADKPEDGFSYTDLRKAMNTGHTKATKLSDTGLSKILALLENHDAILPPELKHKLKQPYRITENGLYILMRHDGRRVTSEELDGEAKKAFLRLWKEFERVQAKVMKVHAPMFEQLPSSPPFPPHPSFVLIAAVKDKETGEEVFRFKIADRSEYGHTEESNIPADQEFRRSGKMGTGHKRT